MTVSISECTASLSMAAEPVMAAATDFARATIKLPAKAAQTEKTVLLFAIVSYKSRALRLGQRLKYRTVAPPCEGGNARTIDPTITIVRP